MVMLLWSARQYSVQHVLSACCLDCCHPALVVGSGGAIERRHQRSELPSKALQTLVRPLLRHLSSPPAEPAIVRSALQRPVVKQQLTTAVAIFLRR